MATTRRPGTDVDSPNTVGGFRDSIIASRHPDSGRGKEVDYLAERSRVARWLKLLSSDPTEAKEAAFALLSEQNSLKLPFTAERTEALFHFDRGVHGHMLTLEADFLAAQIGGELEDVLWRACSELGRAMIVTYESAFTDNLERLGSRAALLTLTLIIVRIIHYLAWQARLTAYRRNDWIPGRWQQLHRLYRKARAFNIQTHAVSDLSDPARKRKTSIESEYLSLMLMWRLNSGTLSRTEIAQAYYWLKDRPRTVAFAPAARPGTRLAVDPMQAEGLKPLAHLTGGGERFLFDSAELSEPLAATIARIDERLKAGPREPENTRLRQQAELVRYLAMHWVVDGFAERAERVIVDHRVEGFVGFPAIMARLKALEQRPLAAAAARDAIAPLTLQISAAKSATKSATKIATKIAGSTSRPGVRRGWDDPATKPGSTEWVIRDQSTSGCRVVSPMPKGSTLKVGDVIAMLDTAGAWDVALVRRWKLAGDDRIEMGLLWLARNARAVKLFPMQDASGTDSLTPAWGLGGEQQGGDHRVLFALLPAVVCTHPEKTWERAVPEGKATMQVEKVELQGVDWCWVRVRVSAVEAGTAGAYAAQSSPEDVTEIEITAPPE